MDANVSETFVIGLRVRRGSELLDRVRPDWWRAIDLDRLAMDRCDQCILGQVYGDFFSGLDEFAATLHGEFHLMPSVFGFDITPRHAGQLAGVSSDYRHLADAWRAEVCTRAERSTTTPSPAP